jgi:uncharacterized repeat protein (TIGR01451 family)
MNTKESFRMKTNNIIYSFVIRMRENISQPRQFVLSCLSVALPFLFLVLFPGHSYGQFSPPVWHTADQKTASGSGTSLSVARPDNVAAGDLIILVLTQQRSPSTTAIGFSTPTGFSLIRDEHGTGSNSRVEVTAFYKIATGSEPANYTSTITQFTNIPQWKAIATRVTGHDPNSPIGSSNGTNSGSNSVTSLTIPGITTSTSNSLLVAARSVRLSVSGENTPTGMSLEWTANGTGSVDGSDNAPAFRGASQTISIAGATGSRQFTWTGSARAAGLMFAVNPDPASANLQITKTFSAGPHNYGENVTFSLSATNLGSFDATGVVVTDLLPSGFGYVSHSTAAGIYTPVNGIWTIGNLNNGGSATLEIVATIVCNEVDYTNTATIAGNEYDPESANNLVSVTLAPTTGTTPCPVIANDDLVTTIQGSPVSFNVLTNDKGNFDPSTLIILVEPQSGSLQMGTGGAITYLPNGNFYGNDQLSYQICDNSDPAQCDIGTVYITVEPNYTDPCAEAVRSKIFYMPFPENELQLRKILASASQFALSGGSFPLTNNARTIISIKVPYPGTLFIYDHWEDGYEADITLPVQPTSQIWGDGILTNGVAPGTVNDIIPPGGSIVLDNTFAYNTRNQSQIQYDGKDKLFSSADVAISKVSGDAGARFPVQNVKSDVVDITRFGTLFVVGFGENTNVPTGVNAFRYVGALVRASADGTIVNLDYDGNGTIDVTSPILSEGEVWLYDGTSSSPGTDGNVNQANDIKAGATITSNYPVGVDVAFGDVNASTFGMRNVPVLPGSFYGNTYYTPVHQTLTGTNAAPVVAYFYNSLNTVLTINWQNGSGGSGSFNLPAKGLNYLSLTAASGYKFESSGGQAFTAISVIDVDNAGGNYDWAFNMITSERLTTYTSIAWAPGSATPPQNFNPVWVTPTAATTIYVKYDGNLTATSSSISPCNIPYDVSFAVGAMGSVRIFNPSGDQSGMAIYTCDGTPIAAVWGQDANAGGPTPVASPGMDVGYVMQPKCLDYLILANDDREVTEPDIPVVIGVSANDAGFLCTVNTASVTTVGLLQPENGTIVVNGDGTITYTPDPGFTGVDVFEYSICSIEYPDVCDIATVTILVQSCEDRAQADANLFRGRVYLEQMPDDGAYDSGESLVPGVQVNLFSDLNCDGIVNGSDAVLATTVTNLSGYYEFSTGGDKFAKDDFDPTAGIYSGNDGTINWIAAWTRSNTTNIVSLADPIPSNSSNIALRLTGPTVTASRSMTFTGATGASLKFSLRRQGLDNQGEAVTVSINGNTLMIIEDGDASGTDLFYQDIVLGIPLASINPNSSNAITFTTNGNTLADDYFWIDNVELIYFPTCFIVQVDPGNTGGRFVAASLSQQVASFDNLGNCDYPNYLGVLAVITAVDDFRTVITDVPLVIDVLTNDSGAPDPATVTTFGLVQPSHGTVMVNADGTITYTPDPGYSGTDQFEYQVCSLDDPAVCDIALVTLNITCLDIPGQNTITGLVYLDIDIDGTYDAGEPGYMDLPVQLYNDTNGNGAIDAGEPLLITESTSATGGYQFNVLNTATQNNTLRDEFTTNGSGSGTNGTIDWSANPWVETGESNGFGTANIYVTGNQLRIQGNGASSQLGAYRSADLTNALSANLSFNFTESGLDSSDDWVDVQIAESPSGPWTTLVRYQGSTNTSGTASFDIAPYISASTTLRLIESTSTNMGTSDYVLFDNVQILYTTNTSVNYIVRLAEPLPAGYVQSSVPQVYAVSFPGSGGASCQNNFGLAGADLMITKTVDNEEPYAGTNVTFTLTVTNLGPTNATGAVVSDLLPAGYTYVSDNGSGTYIPGTGEWTIGNLALNATASLQITATVIAGGNHQNTATVSGNQGDPVPDNNTATQTVDPMQSADLAITKTDMQDPVLAGNTITYTLLLTNNGPSQASNIMVNDVIPALLTNISVTPSMGTWLAPTWSVSTLASGSSATLTIVATVPPDAQITSIINEVTVTSDTFDPVTANNSDTEETTINHDADLLVTKSLTGTYSPIYAGGMVEFEIWITNTGPGVAYNVMVFDEHPNLENMEYSYNGTTWFPWVSPFNVGTLQINETTGGYIRAKVKSNITGNFDNTVSVTWNSFGNATETNSASATVLLQTSADLGIVKQSLTAPLRKNGLAYFDLVVTNYGPSDAVSVSVTDNFTANFNSPEYYDGTTWVAWTGLLNIGNVASGGSYTLQLRARIDNTASNPILNTAVVASDTPDPNPVNNSSSTSGSLNVEADLSILKTAPASVVAGETITYTIAVTNLDNNYDAVDVLINDNINTSYLSNPFYSLNNSDPWTSWSGSLNIGTLNHGSTYIIYIRATVLASVTSNIPNTAVVTSGTPDPVPANNTSATTTPVTTSADVSVLKVLDPGPVIAGQDVYFTITITNNGPSFSQGVYAVETPDTDLNNLMYSTDNGTNYYALPQNGQIIIGSMSPGTSVSIKIKANVNLNACETITNTGSYLSSTSDPNAANNSSSTSPVQILDQTNPVITSCFDPQTVNCAGDVPLPDATGIVASDNCTAPGNLVKVHVGDVISNQVCANRYTITRTYSVTDASGNVSFCVQTITVDDQMSPAITGIIDMTTLEGCDAGVVPAPVTSVAGLEALGLIISDLCNADADLTVSSSDSYSGTCPIVVTRTYTITDLCGNASSYDQIIRVDDDIAPVITCPATRLPE